MSGATYVKTRFKELGYRKSVNCYRVVDTETDSNVGPQYRTRDELLADLERYATEFGCNKANLLGAALDLLADHPEADGPLWAALRTAAWGPDWAAPCKVAPDGCHVAEIGKPCSHCGETP